MWRLVCNEFQKIFRRKKYWIVFAILAAIMALFTVSEYRSIKEYSTPAKQIEMLQANIKSTKQTLNSSKTSAAQKKSLQANLKQMDEQIKELKKSEKNENYDWRRRVQNDIRDAQKNLRTANRKNNKEDIDKYQLAVQFDKYYLDNNINPYDKKGQLAISTLEESNAFMYALIGIILIAVLVADTISGEASPPTIKMLLTKPVSRGKVLFSKFIASSISCCFMFIIIKIGAYIGLGIADGFNNPNKLVGVGSLYQLDPSKNVNGKTGVSIVPGSTHLIQNWQYDLEVLGVSMLFIVTCVALFILVSVVIKNPAASMGVSVALALVLSVVNIMSMNGSLPSALSKLS
ncbi:MAG: ABC transporter permease subunit, partial [Bacillota bacterium]|nr:ABC transporter permease subunit [Bacillota bacterium]